MNNQDIISKFILDNFLKVDTGKTLLDDTSFLDEGIIDSVGVLELVAFLEETFGFRVEDEELIPENLDSLVKITAYVEAKLAVKKS
jgi:acyl carrier protein